MKCGGDSAVGQTAAHPDTSTAGSAFRQVSRELRAVRSQRWGNPWGYLFITPALILFLVFNIWPIFRGLAMAFTDYRYLVVGSEWKWNGLNNFREMFTNDPQFWQSLWISIKFTLLSFPASILLAFGAALLISRIHRALLAGAYRVIAYLPVILPVSVAIYLWAQLYSYQYGYINLVLTDVFGVQSPPNWLGDVKLALPSIVVASLWKSFGANTLLVLVGIYGISDELYQAAAIDGAGTLRQIWSITLPLLRPIFVLIIILSAGIASVTEEPLLMTQGGPANSTLTLGLYLYQQAFLFGDQRLGYAAAMSLFLGVIHMVAAAITFKLLRTERG